jgi:SAM-dependent methyltransferase
MPSHHNHHGHVRLDEADWSALVSHAEQEGEVLLTFVTDAAEWISSLRGHGAPPVRRIIDIGSGPGVGSCELARCFPDATVVAVDGSPAMLERARSRATALGLGQRVQTLLAELPNGLDEIEPAEVIWASMSLHHIGDEVAALRVLRHALAPGGLVAIAEFGDATTFLPATLDIGTAGLTNRLDRALADWFDAMRAGLDHTVASSDLTTMLGAAGYEVVGNRFARVQLDPPLALDARRMVHHHLTRLDHQLEGRLDDDDRAAVRVLTDPADPRGVMHRDDVFVAASRRMVVARSAPDRADLVNGAR